MEVISFNKSTGEAADELIYFPCCHCLTVGRGGEAVKEFSGCCLVKAGKSGFVGEWRKFGFHIWRRSYERKRVRWNGREFLKA